MTSGNFAVADRMADIRQRQWQDGNAVAMNANVHTRVAAKALAVACVDTVELTSIFAPL